MKKVFNKIVVVSLDEEISSKLCKALSEELSMIFCRAKDLVEYELLDSNQMKEILSEQFLADEEKKVFEEISSFTGVVVSVNYDNFVDNLEVLKQNSALVFLKLSKIFVTEKINKIAFEERTKQLEKLCDISISVSKIDKKVLCEKIITKLGEIL